MKDHITVPGQDGKFAAYIARPETVPAPAVVVLQELFGVNADIRRHCDELAEQGYLAVAPDLYWRQEPGVDLNVTSQADWDHGLRLYSAYDRDAGVRDIKDTIDAVRNLQECNGKVALLGYCLGALMVFMTAVRKDGIDAARSGITAQILRNIWERSMGFRRPFSCTLPKRMSSFPRLHKRRLRWRLRRNQMRRCTATWGKIMPSIEITEHTTTPLPQHSPTDVQENSYINICSDFVRHA